MKYILNILLVLTCLAEGVSAQTFEGKITVKTEVLDAPAEMASMKSMLESTVTTYIKDTRSRMESSSPFMGEMIVLTDYEKKESITCMSFMGQKKAIVSPLGEPTTGAIQMPTDFDYRETGNTKTILGYTCNETIATYNAEDGKPMEMSIWYTKALPNRNVQYVGLTGMPLEYTIHAMGLTMKMLTTGIESQSVANDKFDLPNGYVLTTQEEMQRSMNGSGGRK